MKKFFRKIHLWLSIPLGIIISIICFTGAILLFEKEITEWQNKDIYYVTSSADAKLKPWDTLITKATLALPDSVDITGITAYPQSDKALQMALSKPRRTSVCVDPYTGRITGKAERTPFFSIIFQLHRWLMDQRVPEGKLNTGRMVTGTTTLLFIIILISGIIIWFPKSMKGLKNSLKLHFTKGIKPLLHSLHCAGGSYAFIILLCMALTGLTWSFTWYRTTFYALFGAEITQQTEKVQTRSAATKEKKQVAAKELKPCGDCSTCSNHYDCEASTVLKEQARRDAVMKSAAKYQIWQKVYQELKAEYPDYKQISIQNGEASVTLGAFGNANAADRFSFDEKSGKITQRNLYRDAKTTQVMKGLIFSIHTGTWGGLFTRVLYLIAALIGGTLPLTGYYIWIKKQQRKKE